MRCFRLLAVAVLIAVLALPVGYAATGIVDQKQETVTPPQGWILPTVQPAGQEFVPSLSPLIGVDVHVVLQIANFLTVNIRESTIGGNIISTVSRQVPPVGWWGVWLHFDLPIPVPVTVGSTYVLELTATDQCGWVFASADPYLSGRMIRSGAFVPDEDFAFRTYAPGGLAVGGVIESVNMIALLSPWLAVIGLVGCVGAVAVVVKKRRACGD